jgi:16S rRNA (adenine(1408)-N(1))-methyltransferase
VIDLGTGDGRFVLASAAAHPDLLVIGVDAAASSMLSASRRAARPTKRGGLPNALFVVAAAEALPSELEGCADALTVQFPWGSLLRGLLEADSAILAGLARVTKPGARVKLLLSVIERDQAVGRCSLDEASFASLAPRYVEHGLLLRKARLASAEQVAQAHSTWGKRLGAGGGRPAWAVQFDRVGATVLSGRLERVRG